MESIKEIFRIGNGPSSSHTMGPKKAAERFLAQTPNASSYRVTLYGSLAATGRGHLTDVAIQNTLGPDRVTILWERETFLKRHPNALKLEALDSDGKVTASWTVYSVGGGAIVDDQTELETVSVYPDSTMDSILGWCYENGKSIWEYVEVNEGPEIWNYLANVWHVMEAAVKRGLDTEGTLPGVLKYPRKAAGYYAKARNFKPAIKKRSLLYAYALAVSEENAAGGEIVTAPTCGASGVLPAVLYYMKKYHKSSEQKILHALATAGLIGTLVKTNASISGAEVGCQGEVGTACAMASAAVTQLSGGSIFQIEYAAEMGLEHHLGLTCDPIAGLVQVPCIERNAFAAARALNHKNYALLSDGRHLISFDKVVQTMKQTGHDLPHLYKETSEGGLAHFHGLKM
ncbi:L-serine ammonia-lyase [Prolixibacter denitrificans]|uniref:L-serine dehydratase n=1 Tax=Prolixibacter denitrificans TaxID=1541063 RepID=A0A2P8C9I8_9BACT|nr:L-serine ammonia-lyase [Prolixibacter denitrificans]PSK81624.1 L-serine dehydratase [Prolixibacter denitrificans]GET21150.1 L-serine dehydratase [Prolixibacter denitrificans]